MLQEFEAIRWMTRAHRHRHLTTAPLACFTSLALHGGSIYALYS
jgi:hypothetical protein